MRSLKIVAKLEFMLKFPWNQEWSKKLQGDRKVIFSKVLEPLLQHIVCFLIAQEQNTIKVANAGEQLRTTDRLCSVFSKNITTQAGKKLAKATTFQLSVGHVAHVCEVHFFTFFFFLYSV